MQVLCGLIILLMGYVIARLYFRVIELDIKCSKMTRMTKLLVYLKCKDINDCNGCYLSDECKGMFSDVKDYYERRDN